MTINENKDSILDEMDELKSKKNRNFSSVVNKRKISKLEMDDFFMGG